MRPTDTLADLVSTFADFVNHQHDPKAVENLTQQRIFAERWSSLDPSADVSVASSIEGALNRARELAKKVSGEDDGAGEKMMLVFITGSLHLVGGTLAILEKVDAL
jgi:folylpolyglutamate synthase